MAYKVCILSSDDPLLKADRAQEFIKKAREEVPEALFMILSSDDFQSTRGANLALLENELIDPGLFGGDRIIKIYLKDLDATACEVLNLIAKRIRDGVYIVIDLPRINASFNKEGPLPFKEESKVKLETRKKHALSFIKGIGGSVEILYTPEGRELLEFISKRCAKYGFTSDSTCASYIAQACEGNLIAIDQALQLMQLTLPSGKIALNDVDRFFVNDARFSGYEFTEALFNADGIRALNILNSFCTGPSTSLSEALSLLLGRLESALNAIYEGRESNLLKKPFAERVHFFQSFGLKTPKAQDAVLKAISSMPLNLLNFLSLNLSKASKDFASFSHEKAYLTLQEMAVSVINYEVEKLNLEEISQ